MSDYDAIIIGAGHNGLVAANVLAKSGAKVLVLERAHFLGGMAATRELFDGYKHSVGAWAVLIWRQEMTERLELTKWGFELMNQWTSTCTFGAPEDTPFVMYNDLERMGRHLLEDHGPDVAAGLGGLFAHIGRFAPYFVDSAFGPPLDIIEVIATAAHPGGPPRLRPDVVRQHDGHGPPLPRARPGPLHPGLTGRNVHRRF